MSPSVLNVEQTPPIVHTEDAAAILAEYDATVEVDDTTDEDRLVSQVDGHAGLMVHAGVPVTRRVIEAADFDVIARCGIGVDNVDLAAAAERGVTVVNHPAYSVEEVATHAVSLALAGFRRLPTFDHSTRGGNWAWADGAAIDRLSENTIGLVGFGSIARRVAVLVSGFGCDVIAADPYVDGTVMRRHNVEPVEFDELWDRANILSIHAELTPETKGLIGRAALERLDDDAVLVNTARGPVVDTNALVETLAAGGLSFAALDVTDPEPLPADYELFEFENVMVTPHTGWYSERSREELTRDIADDVGRVLAGEEPRHPVVQVE